MANRICLGNHASYGYGLYVSKPGKNAQSDTDLDLIFNSETAHGGGVINQIIDITCSSSTPYEGTATITDLGYIPFIHVTELSASGIKGIESWWGRSIGGGSGGGGGGGMGGSQHGRSQIRWSSWRATVTQTQISIRPWLISGSNQNIMYDSTVHSTATGLSWPGNTTGGITFRCFVYKIAAS